MKKPQHTETLLEEINMSKATNTIVIPIIRQDFIGRCLETLWKKTPPNFRVIVIDQTGNEDAYKKYKHLTHMWIFPWRNLGFSKAMNTGILLANTPYITLANDDLEFLDSRWWNGIMETFKTDERIIAVNPMSPREGAWGYGLTKENESTWVPKKGFIRDPDDPESVIPEGFKYKKNFSSKDYDWLLNEHPCWGKDTLCDGIAMWCTVFKKEGLEEIGLLDERFYPGSGEDYDMCGRAYSCAWPDTTVDNCIPEYHKRMVGTTKSWVWHHWGKSKEKVNTPDLLMSRDNWNHLDRLWPNGFDTWGHYTDKQGNRRPYKRVPEVHIEDL